ncbi:hypothetical protein L484_011403 [Morus notabilis]|uniref:Uncharacterized protein n=1 Tax=Morus notabilis TaxID=981085 RepID=W9S8K6_9ROSA|nr:uncharacterized protein LOC21394664 [Morus notabilis]EXC20159.1 hypothetical protein L484_011403 [Morus notabilis]
MKSLSSVGIGLSVVFSCLFLALIAELYYLFWWKKRLITNRSEIENHDYISPAKELFYMFCWRKHSAFSHSALNPQEICSSSTRIPINDNNNTLLQEPNDDFLFKPFEEDGPETQFMTLQNCSGPPRFLFTIVEETKEDLESEDGKSHNNKSKKGSRSRSLSDLLVTLETPYLTPLASPPFFTPPLTPGGSYGHQGINFLFQSTAEEEFNRIIRSSSSLSSSPPPKFKFLQEAEEKLIKKRLMEKAETETGLVKIVDGNIISDKKWKENEGGTTPTTTTISSILKENEEDESFITITVDKNKAREIISSQVLPLASSPSTFRSAPINKKLNPH